jgi:hypothetical protein
MLTDGQGGMVSIGLTLTPSEENLVKRRWHAVRIPFMGFAAFFIAGCASQLEFPPMGDPLPYTARLEIPTSIKKLSAEYSDSCGHLIQVPVGSRIEDALIEGAYRTFKVVAYEGGGSKDSSPDYVVRVDLVNWSFELDKDYLYDRAPASIHLSAMTRVYDMKGTVLRESEIKVVRRERLRLEQVSKNCEYIIDPFIRDTAVDFATKVSLEVRQAFGGQPSTPIAQRPASTPSSLRFKAMVLDENSNLILEGGERVRVRVDVVNTGANPIQNASASLLGTPSIIGQFPATTLSIPPLQPGETKTLEFVATLPLTVQPQRVEIQVVVEESWRGPAAPSQTLSLTIQPTGTSTDDVNQVPAPVSGFQRPHTYLVSIGIGSYRDPQIQPRKHASLDAEMVANYFQSLGGVPSTNVRLLQDWKALRPDIDEVLLHWLPSSTTKDAVVIVYFSGQAMVAPTGEVLLVPYEGSPTATTGLYPLKDLDSALSRLKAKQTILLFDGMVSKLHRDPKGTAVGPRWELSGGNTIRLIGGEGFAKGVEDDKHRHGLFTYYLLRGLRGDADTNRDSEVTLGEIAAYVRQKVAWTAKSQFNVDQRPQIVPILKPGDKASSLLLSKLAFIAGSERP